MSLGSIYIVGAGRVGTALGLLAQRAGLDLTGLWTRGRESARRVSQTVGRECSWGPLPDAIGRARIVIVSVSDPEVQAVAGALLDGGLLRGCEVLLHCGGARAAREALENVQSAVPVGTLHPLVAVASPEQAARTMPGAYFAIEGDRPARELARELAQGLGVGWFELEADQMALYHAAAVMASNHAVALWHAASLLLTEAGLDSARGQEVLLPLLRSTLENVETLGVRGALTGPVRRGDPDTVEGHLRSIERRAPELAPLYCAGTAQAVALARETGEDPRPGLDAILDVIRRTVNQTRW